jgi:rhodanese-related sulfurtransferase
MNETPADYVVVSDLQRLLTEDSTITLIDARTPEEFAEGHVPAAINVPISVLTEFAQSRGNAANSLIVTMCGSTGRGEKAAAILYAQSVRNVVVLEGGLKAWRDAGLPVA